MSDIVKKLDKFRSSTSFFVFMLLNGLFLVSLPLKQLFSVNVFNYAFYFNLFFLMSGIFSIRFYGKIVLRRINEKEFLLTSSITLLKISDFLFSANTQKEIFEPIVADWQEEYFEALFKKEIWKARWINVRYTYAFLAAMWQKSPIGDLIEFISKIAK